MKRYLISFVLGSAACSSSSASAPSRPGSESATNGGNTSQTRDAGATNAGGTGGLPGNPQSDDAGLGATDGGIVAVSDGGAQSSCGAGTGCGSLAGFVERTATSPTHGGKGPVYVAVFDGNPITDQTHATVVARSLLPAVDLTASNARVPYLVPGIPPRAQPYQVIAFLDDANAVSAANPVPAAGDLISMQIAAGSFSGIQAVIGSPSTTTVDLPLNAAMP